MIHLHKWTKWSNPFVVDMVRDTGSFGEVTNKPATIQERKCRACNLVKTRIVHDGERRKRESER